MARPCISSTLGTAINSGCVSQTVGIENDSVLIAQSLINKATLAFESDSVICTTFALIGAANGSKVTVKGDMPYKDTKVDGKMGTYVQLFDSSFMFPILENSPATAKQVMQLGNDKYVAVVQFKGYDAAKKNKYGIIGLNRGLQFETSNLAFDTQENFGYKIALKETEGLVPLYFFWDTDEATTDLWFAALLP
jgi:hypothetical protein